MTGLARALLFWFSVRIGIAADPMLATTDRWDLFGAGVSRLKRAFALQFLVLGMAVFVFDFLPNAAIARWLPGSQQELATSLLVAAKNPTVIAGTILWMTGVAHELMRIEMRADPGSAARGAKAR